MCYIARPHHHQSCSAADDFNSVVYDDLAGSASVQSLFEGGGACSAASAAISSCLPAGSAHLLKTISEHCCGEAVSSSNSATLLVAVICAQSVQKGLTATATGEEIQPCQLFYMDISFDWIAGYSHSHIEERIRAAW